MRDLDTLNKISHDFAASINSEPNIEFTGWKPNYVTSGLVGQWVDYRQYGQYFYVNMPGMTGGPFKSGDQFNIEGPQLEPYEWDDYEKAKALIQEGLDRLLTFSV